MLDIELRSVLQRDMAAVAEIAGLRVIQVFEMPPEEVIELAERLDVWLEADWRGLLEYRERKARPN